MAATEPRTTIRNIIRTYILANPIFEDDGFTPSNVGYLWEGGPEGLMWLFYIINYDVLITFGDPKSREMRRVEDEPVHYLMSVPVTVTTMNKYLAGALICTAAEMQYKATYAIRMAIEAGARSAIGGPVAYRLHVTSDNAKYKRIGPSYIWETVHSVEYETGYP